jgi:hypothetical protein
MSLLIRARTQTGYDQSSTEHPGAFDLHEIAKRYFESGIERNACIDIMMNYVRIFTFYTI